MLRSRRIGAFPVVNDAGGIIGVVSEGTCSAVQTTTSGTRSSIRSFLPSLAEPKDLKVAVHDGIVTNAGDPRPDPVDRAIVDAIRHVQGVLAVRDRRGGSDRS